MDFREPPERDVGRHVSRSEGFVADHLAEVAKGLATNRDVVILALGITDCVPSLVAQVRFSDGILQRCGPVLVDGLLLFKATSVRTIECQEVT